MHTFELNETVFTLKSLKYPSPSFNITDYITFADGNTRSYSSGKMIMLETMIMQVDSFSSIESLDCGMPYPLMTYIYLLKLTRQQYISFFGCIFYQTLDMITLKGFIFYAHIVDVPTHPTPFNVTL